MSSLFERRFDWNPSVPPPPPPRSPIASWYTPGQTDGFGDRLLMSDNASASSLELLRFRPQFCLVRGFERALRARVERQKFFRHQAFSVIRAVEYLERQRGLALVSVHTPGRRLSDLLDGSAGQKGVHPKLAGWLIRQLVPALADLQATGGGPHGLLTADRIVLTPECMPVVVEHVLGQAIEQLYLSPARLWSEFGLVAPSAIGVARFDNRSDVMQLGLIVLGLLLGRRITPSEYPSTLAQLLDECGTVVARRSPALARPLRTWLERALRIDGLLYKSAADAQRDLAGLPEDLDPEIGGLLPGADSNADSVDDGDTELFGGELPAVSYHAATDSEEHLAASNAAPHVGASSPPPRSLDAFEPEVSGAREDPAVSVGPPRASTLFGSLNYTTIESPDDATVATPSRDRPTGVRPLHERAALVTPLMAMCALLALVVVAQSVVIMRLLDGGRTASAPSAVARSGASDVTPSIGQGVQAQGTIPAAEPQATEPRSAPASPLPVNVPPRSSEPSAAATARARSGGLRVLSPLPLVAVEGDRVLGSSADGPIYAAAGVHEIDFVNSAVGLKERRTVTFKPGEVVSLRITPPEGRLSINASPWAQVWVDGRALGETPIANVTLPPGEHLVTFRHPQLGEVRRTVIVRTDGVTRVSTSLSE